MMQDPTMERIMREEKLEEEIKQVFFCMKENLKFIHLFNNEKTLMVYFKTQSEKSILPINELELNAMKELGWELRAISFSLMSLDFVSIENNKS